MRRSRRIRLALLGTAGLAALTACDQAEDPLASGQFFTDAQACESAYDPAECRAAFARAQEEHVRTAPKFASREACEAEFGAANCTPAPAAESAPAAAQPEGQLQTQQAGGSWFMPVMMGYMMGRMAGGGFAASPLYRDTRNVAYSGRQQVGRIDSARMPPPRAVAGTPGVPSFAQRGGFGRSGFGAGS